MVIEVIAGVLVFLLAVATTAAVLIGLAGAFGVLRLTRCTGCNRLGVSGGRGHPGTCVSCRHERVLHPLSTLRAGHAARHVGQHQ